MVEDKVEETELVNFVGTACYKSNDPVSKLFIVAASSFFGEPKYYMDKGKVPATLNSRSAYTMRDRVMDILHGRPDLHINSGTTTEFIESAIDDALAYDLERTLKMAVTLRSEFNIRTTPQVIMVRAANHAASKGTGMIRKYASGIMRRGDEPAAQMSYHTCNFTGAIPNSLKKSWKDYLNTLSEYQLAKYRMENRSVKTIDVVRVCHANSPAIDKLVYGQLKLNNGETWESYISANGSSKKTWEHVIDNIFVEEE